MSLPCLRWRVAAAGDHAQIDFGQGETRFGGGEPKIHSCRHFKTETETGPVDCHHDRLLHQFHLVEMAMDVAAVVSAEFLHRARVRVVLLVLDDIDAELAEIFIATGVVAVAPSSWRTSAADRVGRMSAGSTG